MGTKHREGGPARVKGASGIGIVGILTLALLLVLAGCALNGEAASPTPASTANNNSTGTPGAHATLTLPTLTAVASPSGPAGPGGAGEFCSKPPDVTIHPGSNIPIYPGANLHFTQSNGNNAFYGFCTSASTTAVHDFYSVQLSKSGWSGLQTSTIAAVVQITANQCASTNPPRIIVTIAPDTSATTTTSISIVVLAGAC